MTKQQKLISSMGDRQLLEYAFRVVESNALIACHRGFISNKDLKLEADVKSEVFNRFLKENGGSVV